MCQFMKTMIKSCKRLGRKIRRASSDPFCNNCFEELLEEFRELSPEEIERIKKKIDEL